MGLPPYPKNGFTSNAVPINPFASTTKDVEINLRKHMKSILEGDDYEPRRGHWVLLRRMDTTQKCSCWNQKGDGKDANINDDGKYNEPKLRCPICHGEGWVYHDELHLARRVLISPEVGMANATTMTDIGWMTVNYIVFYFMYYVSPKQGDKIIEVVLDDAGTPVIPMQYIERYKISVAEPYRDINGRVEYWRAAAKLEVATNG